MLHDACGGKGCVSCDRGFEKRPITLWEVDFYRELSTQTKEMKRACGPWQATGRCWRCDAQVAKYEGYAERAVLKFISQGCECPTPCQVCQYRYDDTGKPCYYAAAEDEKKRRGND